MNIYPNWFKLLLEIQDLNKIKEKRYLLSHHISNNIQLKMGEYLNMTPNI